MAGFGLWLYKYPSKRDAFDPVIAVKRFFDKFRSFDFVSIKALKHFIVIIVGISACFLLIFPTVSMTHQGQEDVTGDEQVTDENHPVTVIGNLSKIGLGFALVLLPLIEEYVFRSELLRFVERKSGPLIAIFISAACFGLFHLLNPGTGLFAFAPPLVLGIVFSSVYLYSGFWGSYLTHAGYNLAFLVLLA